MTADNKFCLLMLIINKRLTPQAMQIFENIPIHLQIAGHGTANSDMMDILGLGGIEKDVLATVLSKGTADELLNKLFYELELSQKNTGIAYTVPLSGMSNLFMKICEQNVCNISDDNKEMINMSEIKYSVIAATVSQGYSEEVMNSARAAGARGGTVFHNNAILSEDAKNSWGLDFTEEKETVLIITEKEKKLDIMKAICDSCGLHSEAKGIVISLPIDNIMGLNS